MRTEKSEKGHAFEGGTSGIQQAACEALNPVKARGKMASAEMLSSALIASSEPLISCPHHCEVCLGATVLGFHSALVQTRVLAQVVTLQLLDPSPRSWLREGLISWDLVGSFSGCV